MEVKQKDDKTRDTSKKGGAGLSEDYDCARPTALAWFKLETINV
jgi:hypothetical protein